MFKCVVSLSHMLSVKCLSVLSRYRICYLLNVCVLSRYLSPVVEILIILYGMLCYCGKKSINKKCIDV